jgi:hypothetical protein
MSDQVSVVSKESWEQDNSEGNHLEEREEDSAPVRLWSECLTSLGGMGLQLTCNKAKLLSRCNGRAAQLLLETTQLFDTYAQDLLKAANSLSSFSDKAVPSIQQLAVTSSDACSQLSKKIKSITLPLQGFLGTYEDAANSLHERYKSSRRTAEKARQKALTARSVYVVVYKEVTTALEEWKKEHDDGDDANKRPPERIASKLAQLKACEKRYKRLVQWENECVRVCRRLEVMALESMQKLEEDRFVIFAHSLIKLLTTAAKDTSPNKPATLTAKESSTEADTETPFEKKNETRAVRKHSLGTISMTVSEEEGVGALDAETLGLPKEIGQLRDQVRLLAAARARTVQTARALASFLESVAVASAKLGSELKQQQINGYESVLEELSNTGEGARSMKLWSGFSKALGQGGDDALVFAEQLRSLRSDKLGHIIEYGDKILKPIADRENATWKQLCDVARSQAQAEARYTEATVHKAKARNRCKSVDSDGTVGASFAIAANKHVSQSLANMFAILPNGGEHAMKVLDPSMRASVAQLSLEEADHKETKERQLLDSAMELTALSLEAYRSSADPVLRQCEAEEPEDYFPLLESLAEHFADFRAVHQNSLSGFHHLEDRRAWLGAPSYVNTWSSTAHQSLTLGLKETTPDLSASTEPMLSIELEQSEVVPRALHSLEGYPDGLPEAADVVLDEDTETEAYDEGSISSLTTPLRERAASASSMSAPKSPVDENPTSWLMRSLTMPDTDSIFGKLNMTKKVTRIQQPEFNVGDTETSIFATYFWPDNLDSKSIPLVIGSFACSFRAGAQRFPFQYGRVFITSVRMIFVGWTRKQLSLSWAEVVGIEPVKNSMSSQNDSFIVTCRKKGSTEESFMVLSGFYVRQHVLDLIEKCREQTRATSAVPTTTLVDIVTPPSTPVRSSGAVPADNTLGKMVSILSGRLRSLSIQRFYDIIWSEGNATDEKPFYQPWLEKECFEVATGNWQVNDVTGPWCGENYTQKREIRFKVKRKTHLYIGPPVAEVRQVWTTGGLISSVVVAVFPSSRTPAYSFRRLTTVGSKEMINVW